MTYDEFKKVWDAKGGFDRISFIIFDNGMRWVFNRRKYLGWRDSDGKVLPYEKRYGDYIHPSEYLNLLPDIGCIEMKVYRHGTTAEQENDPEYPGYVWEVRNVENIQLMSFVDDNNATSRPFFNGAQQ